MIEITDRIALDEAEIAVTFIRASGPGGQNVNKVSLPRNCASMCAAHRASQKRCACAWSTSPAPD